MKELRASMETIRKTAGMIIDGIETEMKKQLGLQQEKPIEQMQTADTKAEARPSVLEALKKEKHATEKNAARKGKKAMIADRPKSRQVGKEMVL